MRAICKENAMSISEDMRYISVCGNSQVTGGRCAGTADHFRPGALLHILVYEDIVAYLHAYFQKYVYFPGSTKQVYFPQHSGVGRVLFVHISLPM